MTDWLDRASEREEQLRQEALARVLNRVAPPPPTCGECEEYPVFVTAKGCRSDKCKRCLEETGLLTEGV